jgi:hypothetical protein
MSVAAADSLGNVYALGSNSVVYKASASGALTEIANKVGSLAAAPDGTLYLLRNGDLAGTLTVRQPNGTSFHAENRVASMALVPEGFLYLLRNGDLAGTLTLRWANGTSVPAANRVASMALSSDGTLYLQRSGDLTGTVTALDLGNRVGRLVADRVASMALVPEGFLYLLRNGNLSGTVTLHWSNGTSVPAANRVASMALSPDGTLYLQRSGDLTGTVTALDLGNRVGRLAADQVAAMTLAVDGSVYLLRNGDLAGVVTALDPYALQGRKVDEKVAAIDLSPTGEIQLVPLVAGEWYVAGRKATIQQNGRALTFNDGNGRTATGTILPDNRIEVPAWGTLQSSPPSQSGARFVRAIQVPLVGTLSSDKSRINWSDNSFWTRTPPVAIAPVQHTYKWEARIDIHRQLASSAGTSSKTTIPVFISGEVRAVSLGNALAQIEAMRVQILARLEEARTKQIDKEMSDYPSPGIIYTCPEGPWYAHVTDPATLQRHEVKLS